MNQIQTQLLELIKNQNTRPDRKIVSLKQYYRPMCSGDDCTEQKDLLFNTGKGSHICTDCLNKELREAEDKQKDEFILE